MSINNIAFCCASALEYPMVTSSNPGSDSDKSASGVVQGHAYTLLNATVLNFQGRQIRLVQLRNPWGKGEFTGEWSDDDPRWNSVDPRERQRVGFKKDKNDGIFFMPFEVFWNEFRVITIAEVDDDASYIYKSHKDPNKEGCYFRIEIQAKGMYSLQVDNKPERSFEDKKQRAYQYPNATVDVGIYNNGSVKRIQGFAGRKRTLFQKYDMNPGIYIVKAKIDFDSNFEKLHDVVLAVYGEHACKVELATPEEAAALAGRHVNWAGKEEK